MGGRVWATAVPPGQLLFRGGKSLASSMQAVAQAGVLSRRGEQTRKLPHMILPFRERQRLVLHYCVVHSHHLMKA